MNSEEQFKQFSEKVDRTTLRIGRIPEQYKTRFLEIANKEFMGDYGMCLRELIKIYDGFYPTGSEELEMKLDVLAIEVNKLKETIDLLKDKPKEEKFRYTADGSKKIKE